MGQPLAREVGLARDDDLCLPREPPERRGVEDPGTVALERGAARALRRLLDPTLPRGVVVTLGHAGNLVAGPVSRRTGPARHWRARARRPAGRRASGRAA